MSTEVLGLRETLTAGVAGEIRAQLGRQSISRSELARRLSKDDTWVGKRLNGRTEITLTDLERIADVLGVTAVDLFPRSKRAVTETFLSRSVTPPTVRAMKSQTRRETRRPADLRPVGRPANGSRPDGSRRPQRIA